MVGLSSTEIVNLWDRGDSRSAMGRGLLLFAARGDAARASEITISERDAALANLRRLTFGEVLRMYVECPRCGQGNESSIGVGALFADRPPTAREESFVRSPYSATIRPPSTSDLVAACVDPANARRALIERCVLNPKLDDRPVEPSELPDDVIAEIASRLEALDPLADVSVGFACAACDHRWISQFDVARFFWLETATHAKRLIRDVRALAKAYGWSERDILEMGAARRRAYLDTTGP